MRRCESALLSQIIDHGTDLPRIILEPGALLKVLVVDDNDFDRALISRCLIAQESVAQVRPISNGEEALACIKSGEFQPDLIILDVAMPGMDGFELLGRLTDVEACRRVPMVMLSSSSRDADIQLAVGTYAQSYVVKPSKLSDLESALADIVISLTTTLH